MMINPKVAQNNHLPQNGGKRAPVPLFAPERKGSYRILNEYNDLQLVLNLKKIRGTGALIVQIEIGIFVSFAKRNLDDRQFLGQVDWPDEVPTPFRFGPRKKDEIIHLGKALPADETFALAQQVNFHKMR
jgi:hypothetical protein